jgi:hypothetical protein
VVTEERIGKKKEADIEGEEVLHARLCGSSPYIFRFSSRLAL